MRTYLTFGVAISIICGCSTHKTRHDLAGYSPPIVFTLQSILVTNNNCHIALFEMKNVGNMDMWFTGNSRGEADHYVQRERSIGGWEGNTLDWLCGMDRGWWRLAAGTATNFPVRVWPPQNNLGHFQVGVRLSPSEFPKPSTPNVIYWSEPFSP